MDSAWQLQNAMPSISVEPGRGEKIAIGSTTYNRLQTRPGGNSHARLRLSKTGAEVAAKASTTP